MKLCYSGVTLVSIGTFLDTMQCFGGKCLRVDLNCCENLVLYFSLEGVTEEVGGEPGLSQHP